MPLRTCSRSVVVKPLTHLYGSLPQPWATAVFEVIVCMWFAFRMPRAGSRRLARAFLGWGLLVKRGLVRAPRFRKSEHQGKIALRVKFDFANPSVGQVARLVCIAKVCPLFAFLFGGTLLVCLVYQEAIAKASINHFVKCILFAVCPNGGNATKYVANRPKSHVVRVALVCKSHIIAQDTFVFQFSEAWVLAEATSLSEGQNAFHSLLSFRAVSARYCALVWRSVRMGISLAQFRRWRCAPLRRPAERDIRWPGGSLRSCGV